MKPASDDAPAVADQRQAAEAEPARDDSFDPGLETGYLRRTPRERELPVEAGGAPFDPGPGIGYDDGRAKRAAKERKRRESERREAEARALSERDQELVEEKRQDPEERRRLVEERRADLERQRLERERLEREERWRREREEIERRARLDEERREREHRERVERAELAREQRRRAELARREQREREREERRRQGQSEREAARETEGELQRANRAEMRRRRAAARARYARGDRGPAVRRVAGPPSPEPHPHLVGTGQRGLARPTAKATLALAAVTAVAIGLGSALGLPVPGASSGENLAASLGGSPLAGPGTAPGLTRGPFFPVVGEGPFDFGEAAAKFGAKRGGRRHEGLDIFAKRGTPLVAVRDGIVLDGGGGKSFYAGGGGNSLVIYSPVDDRSYVYLHMQEPALVPAGGQVRAGEVVGQVGCTGSCDGPHLHFEVRNGRATYGGETNPVDPMPLVQNWARAPAP